MAKIEEGQGRSVDLKTRLSAEAEGRMRVKARNNRKGVNNPSVPKNDPLTRYLTDLKAENDAIERHARSILNLMVDNSDVEASTTLLILKFVGISGRRDRMARAIEAFHFENASILHPWTIDTSISMGKRVISFAQDIVIGGKPEATVYAEAKRQHDEWLAHKAAKTSSATVEVAVQPTKNQLRKNRIREAKRMQPQRQLATT